MRSARSLVAFSFMLVMPVAVGAIACAAAAAGGDGDGGTLGASLDAGAGASGSNSSAIIVGSNASSGATGILGSNTTATTASTSGISGTAGTGASTGATVGTSATTGVTSPASTTAASTMESTDESTEESSSTSSHHHHSFPTSNSSDTDGFSTSSDTFSFPSSSSSDTFSVPSSSSEGSSSTGGPAATCQNPPTNPPAGFMPPTGILGTGCSPGQISMIAGCEVATTDAGIQACDTTLTSGAADGSFNSCGTCYDGTVIPQSGNSPSLWGYNEVLEVVPTVGDTADAFLLLASINLGGCIIATDPTNGTQCGLDLMALDACVYQTCLPLCAIPTSLPMSAENAFNACTMAASEGACAEYNTAAGNDCAAVMGGHDSAYEACTNLINQDEGQMGSPEATESSESQLLTDICGG